MSTELAYILGEVFDSAGGTIEVICTTALNQSIGATLDYKYI